MNGPMRGSTEGSDERMVMWVYKRKECGRIND